MKIAIVLPNWIGDAAMATPTLRAISERFGTYAEIIGVMRPYVAEVLEGTSWLDQCVLYDPKSADRSLSSWSLVRRLRSMKLDSIVMLTNSLRTGVSSWLSGAPQRVGYVRNGRGLLLTDKLYAPCDGRRFTPISAVDYYLDLAKHLGCENISRDIELATTDANEEAANGVWKKLGLGNGGETVVLCPGSAFGPAKHWPTEYFAELATKIVDTRGCNVLVACGPAERDNAREIAQLANRPQIVSLADEALSIGLTKACLRRSRLAVATDSGPRHLAAGFGVPTVALFGSTDPRWSLNYNPREIRLNETVPCGPCAKRACPLTHHDCMKHLRVERVFKAVQSLLERLSDTKAA
ncbi:MAG: lipopolysaccharide heptosyltransferase II [Planctomycetes bacterium]|nr:lipopolysaccharide heptosyltransferase II [Planctomycetota bacterium]